MDSLGNWGRWGADDQLGTLNLITPAKRVQAARLVQDGVPVTSACPIATDITADTTFQPMRFMGRQRRGPRHLLTGARGRAARRRRIHRDGLSRLHDHSPRHTGALLLMLAAGTRGTRRHPSRPHYARRLAQGARNPSKDGSPAAHVACAPWFHERGIAMLGPDTHNDVLPLPYPRLGNALHGLSLVAMGLWLIDNGKLEDLATACRSRGRWEFLLTIAPLRLQATTGSPVNPIALL